MVTSSLFMTPERVVFGQGVALQAGCYAKEFGAKKVFVVTDENIAKLDAFKKVIDSLADSQIDHVVYSAVDPNPTDVQVNNGAAVYQQAEADALIGVGGGSALDSAKAIGILASNGGSIGDYAIDADAEDAGPDTDPIREPIPPLIAIPTTSGTGAEVSAYAVITQTTDNHKMGPGGWRANPKVALVDPVMTVSMPPQVTATTGMDALSHAIEAYCSPIAMPQTDALALSSFALIAKHLGPAVADGSNLQAREGMSLASLQAGLCMNAWCGGVHALGHQLSSQYGLPHGLAMAIMMPVVMEFNLIACMDRMADIARALGERIDGLSIMEAAQKAPLAVRRLAASIDLPISLSACGADPNLISVCSQWALKDNNLWGNPRTMTLQQIEALYQKAFEVEMA